jgi:hypothetical protein
MAFEKPDYASLDFWEQRCEFNQRGMHLNKTKHFTENIEGWILADSSGPDHFSSSFDWFPPGSDKDPVISALEVGYIMTLTFVFFQF